MKLSMNQHRYYAGTFRNVTAHLITKALFRFLSNPYPLNYYMQYPELLATSLNKQVNRTRLPAISSEVFCGLSPSVLLNVSSINSSSQWRPILKPRMPDRTASHLTRQYYIVISLRTPDFTRMRFVIELVNQDYIN